MGGIRPKKKEGKKKAPSKYQRVAFREALLHEKHGLRINIIRITEGFEYVALRPDEVDLESFLLDIF